MSNSQFQSLVGNSFGLDQTKNAENGSQKEAMKAMMLDLFHRELKPGMENFIRKVVKEELRNLPTGLVRNPENDVQSSVPRHLKLKFLKNVSLPVLTGEEIRGEGYTSIKVTLVDCSNENVVDSGPEASAKVEIVVLRGDFGGAGGDNWTSEEFNEKIVREREGIQSKANKKREREDKTPLLTGNTVLHLSKGIGFVRNIKFRQYSSWMRNQEFKLGARVLDMFSGIGIKEAVTESFIVRDRRTTCDRKGRPPSLSDDVSKLKNIRKGGSLYKRLHDKKVKTIMDFLIQLFRDPDGLRNVLGVITRCQYFPIHELSEKQKADAHNLAVTAFEHWEDVIFFNDKDSLLQHVSCLSTCEEPSNSPRPDLPCGYNKDATEMLEKQLDSSLSGIISSLDFSPHICTTENFSSLCDDNNWEVPLELHSASSSRAEPCILYSSSMKSLMEFVDNYFRQEEAKKEMEELSIALGITRVVPPGEIHVQKKQRVR